MGKKKTYNIDSLEFSSKAMYDFYIELKILEQQKYIDNFKLPTVKQEIKRKYKSKKCIIDNNTFDSIKEAKVYLCIKKLKKQNKIKSYSLHPKYVLQEKFKKNNKTIRAITYTADFEIVLNDNSTTVIDVKPSPAMVTEVFKLKKKIFEYKYQNKSIVIIYNIKDLYSLLEIQQNNIEEILAKGGIK
mgnify:CR=1 FL=1